MVEFSILRERRSDINIHETLAGGFADGSRKQCSGDRCHEQTFSDHELDLSS
jgi:hypothetical protein